MPHLTRGTAAFRKAIGALRIARVFFIQKYARGASYALALSETLVILLYFEGTSREAGPSSKVRSQNAAYVQEYSHCAGCALALSETLVPSDAACPVGIPPKLRSLNAAYVQEKCA